MAAKSTIFSSTSSNSEVVEACHIWTIQNISFLLKDSQELYSSSFKTSNETSWSWHCRMRQVNRYIEFGLKIGSNTCYSCPRVPAEFRFSIRCGNSDMVSFDSGHKVFDKNMPVHYMNTNMGASKLSSYTTEWKNTLTVVCTVRELLRTTSDYLPIAPCQLKHDLDTILKDALFADVTLIVEGQTIKAHKAILAARSPVFAAMFKSDMVELRQNQVTISDMEYKVAQNLLQFIYTGETEIAPDMARDLLLAADKYGLTRLKSQCEQYISSAVAVTTAIKTLIFADRVNAEHLKSRTMALIKANMEKVMESDDWKTMVVEHPTLLQEVCRTLANK